MGTVNAVPSAAPTVNLGWAANSGTFVAAVNDSSDSTYVSPSVVASAHQYRIPCAATIPPGAVITKVTPKIRAGGLVAGRARIRAQAAAGTSTYATPDYYVPAVGTIGDYTAAAGGAFTGITGMTAVQLAASLVLDVNADQAVAPGSSSAVMKHYQITLQVDYNEQPVASALGLLSATDAARTTRPGLGWTYTDPEADAQTAYRVVVWTATAAADANCPRAAATTFTDTTGTVRTAVAWSGTASDTSVYRSDVTWTPAQDLPTGSLTAFVQVADTAADTVRWSTATSSATWNQSASPAAAPVITGLVWDQANYRASMLVSGAANMLDVDAASNELGDGTSWQANALVTSGPAVATDQFYDGTSSRKWTTSAGNSSIVTGRTYPVVAGKPYSGHVRLRVSVTATGVQAGLQWINAAGAVISTVWGGSASGASNTWQLATVDNQTAPGTAVAVRAAAQILGAASGASAWADVAGVYPLTAAPAAWSSGSYTTAQRVVVERSVDGGTTWTGLPQHTGWTPGGPAGDSQYQQATVYDLALKHTASARYRAKMVSTDLSGYTYTSAYSAVVGPVVGNYDLFVLRDPTDPALLAVLPLVGDLESDSSEQAAKFVIQGAARPVIVSYPGGMSGQTWPLSVQFQGTAQATAYSAVRAAQRPVLILLSDMANVAWWVRFDADGHRNVQRSTSRKDATRRPIKVDFTLVEVAGPVGQPQTAVP